MEHFKSLKREDDKEDIRAKAEKWIAMAGPFQRVFGSKDGEQVLKEIEKYSSYSGSTFNSDPYIHAYIAGQRSMAVFIHNILLFG